MSEDLFGLSRAKAILDPSRIYRYSLTRTWGGNPAHRVVFIMLNPSTADEQQDDPTIRRCIGFAKHWGGHSLDVVNLFAYRATGPATLYGVEDPVGPENVNHVRRAIKDAQWIFAAWGAQPIAKRSPILNELKSVPLFCFGTTGDGSPRHPLYVRSDASMQQYRVQTSALPESFTGPSPH